MEQEFDVDFTRWLNMRDTQGHDGAKKTKKQNKKNTGGHNLGTDHGRIAGGSVGALQPDYIWPLCGSEGNLPCIPRTV